LSEREYFRLLQKRTNQFTAQDCPSTGLQALGIFSIVSDLAKGKNTTAFSPEREELGRHIVADPAICHGQPTFKGTRIMVAQVLKDVADGRSWDFICLERWGGRIPTTAIAEAVTLARHAWLGKHGVKHPPTRRKSRLPAVA